MKKGNKIKLLALIGNLLADYKKISADVIEEFPSKDYGLSHQNLNNEIAGYESKVKELLSGKRKLFVLFMSHRSGDHGLTIHTSIEKLKEEVMSVVELIKENSDNVDEREIDENYNNNVYAVENINGNGYYAELSDTTWFDVFEVEV